MSMNKTEAQDEGISVEAAEDQEFTLGQLREMTKDMPAETPILISAIIPRESDDEEDDSSDDTVESSSDDDDDDDIDVETASVLGAEIEDYEIEGENGAPSKTIKAISLVCHIDELLSDDEDEDEEDEPVAQN